MRPLFVCNVCNNYVCNSFILGNGQNGQNGQNGFGGQGGAGGFGGGKIFKTNSLMVIFLDNITKIIQFFLIIGNGQNGFDGHGGAGCDGGGFVFGSDGGQGGQGGGKL